MLSTTCTWSRERGEIAGDGLSVGLRNDGVVVTEAGVQPHQCRGRGRGDGHPSLAPGSHRSCSFSLGWDRMAVRSLRIWSTPTYTAVAAHEPRAMTGTSESTTVGVSQPSTVAQLARGLLRMLHP